MPHKKGRARDVVPHREHRSSKKAEPGSRPSLSPLIVPARATLEMVDFQLEDLPLPAELWLKAMTYLDVVEVCRCENTSKALWGNLNRENSLWQKLCALHFPAMYSSVSENPQGCPLLSKNSNILPVLPESQKEPFEETVPPEAFEVAIDWKMLFARRCLKQRRWKVLEQRSRPSQSFSSKRCTACGEVYEEEGSVGTNGSNGLNGLERLESCAIHPGDFLPIQPADWSRVELQQLQSYARAAWRSIGGTSAIQRSARVYRGGGYWAKGLAFKGWGSKGHWAEGLGARPGPGNLRLCIIGHVPCKWSCCGAEDLISEGCLLGPHRLR